MVVPASSKYQGYKALAYSSELDLIAGDVVTIPLRNKFCLGLVLGQLDRVNGIKPKPIIGALGRLPKPTLKLNDWLGKYYPGPIGPILQLFLPQYIDGKTTGNADSKLQNSSIDTTLPTLTKDQQGTLSKIRKKSVNSAVLHGETGSGKTRIYIELAKDALASQRSAIILTPEISLTPQLINAFNLVFGEQVLLTHSGLKPSERRQVWWQSLASEKPLVVIGPRSALFLPLKSVGLIVMDESHEPAYKNETSPRYQSSRVVGALAKIHGAKAIFGSATPLVQDYFVANAKGLPILKMGSLASSDQPSTRNVQLIDLLDKTKFIRQAFISDPLIKAVEDAINSGEQALVFLNRRGSARLVVCQNCGWKAVCPTCGLPLIYHNDKHRLMCHNCGHQQAAITSCPTCSGQELIFKGIGTKTLEANLKRLFPKARIKRFDADNLKSESFGTNFDAVLKGDVDILIGTQILAKGLDLPRLSVVGVILADTGLSFPDYTADERTYSLLYQVAGRVGRGHLNGRVFIQSYDVKNPVLESVIKRDWRSFYEQQILQRQKFGYPPFSYLLKLTVEKPSPQAAINHAQTLYDELIKHQGIRIWGPAPSFKEKLGNKYKWQLVIRAKERQLLVDIVNNLPSGWHHDLDPSDLL